MSFRVTHPETQETPAEYAAGEPFKCTGCSWTGDDPDMEDSGHHTVTISIEKGIKLKHPRVEEYCDDCMKICECCGGWLDDNDPNGKAVTVRVLDGQGGDFLTTEHVECIGNYLIHEYELQPQPTENK